MIHVLIVIGLAAGYAVFLLARPDKPCRSCRGWGAKGGRRRSACPRCRGTGRRFRLGARLVHSGAMAVSLYIRERRADRARGDS